MLPQIKHELYIDPCILNHLPAEVTFKVLSPVFPTRNLFQIPYILWFNKVKITVRKYRYLKLRLGSVVYTRDARQESCLSRKSRTRDRDWSNNQNDWFKKKEKLYCNNFLPQSSILLNDTIFCSKLFTKSAINYIKCISLKL